MQNDVTRRAICRCGAQALRSLYWSRGRLGSGDTRGKIT
nr:MAG TPA: hypothetical protein [Caudoviricetes sp.]